jgi:phosphatidylinositol N-acetylglucosaminyltransferase subunit C
MAAPLPTSRAPPPSPPPAPIPPPVPVETHPNRAGLKPPPPYRSPPDPNRLAPEDAYFAHSPPRFRPHFAANINNHNHAATLRLLNGNVPTPAAVAALRKPPAVPVPGPEQVKAAEEARRDRGTSRRRKQKKGVWKKLLWVKQSCKEAFSILVIFFFLYFFPFLFDFYSLRFFFPEI